METIKKSTQHCANLEQCSNTGHFDMPIMKEYKYVSKSLSLSFCQNFIFCPGLKPGTNLNPATKKADIFMGDEPSLLTEHKNKSTAIDDRKEPSLATRHKKQRIRIGDRKEPCLLTKHKNKSTAVGKRKNPSLVTRHKKQVMIMVKKGEKSSLKIFALLLLTITFLSAGCKKGFLDEKPNKAQLVPTTLSDFQKLLDNTYVMNMSPSLTLISGDEFYSDAGAVAAYSTPQQRNAYTWEKDIYEGRSNPDWNISYNRIFYANIVLEGLDKSAAPEQASVMWKTLKGSALFYRAFSYYQLAQVFCTAYQPTSSASALGLPLKLTADINDLPQRSSLADTYQQILSDLGQALDLLPLTVAYKNRPSRAACLAMFSRIYLSMGNYDQAEKYATESLGINAKLTDFNTLNATLTSSANPFPAAFPVGNEEVQYWETLYAYNFLSSSLIVDSTLYRSYATNDLRKSVYFIDRGRGVINFKGYFGGSSGGFFGFANDELFLTRAECLARKGFTNEALADLNTMLRSRWKTGTFINLTAPDARSALELVLRERRKSLFRRGTRWTDLKRLNLDPSSQVTLVKILGGQTYTLPPNDLRYVFPIPDDEIRGSGIEQNPR